MEVGTEWPGRSKPHQQENRDGLSSSGTLEPQSNPAEMGDKKAGLQSKEKVSDNEYMYIQWPGKGRHGKGKGYNGQQYPESDSYL